MAGAVEAVLYGEGWQFFWLAWVVGATIGAIWFCSFETIVVSFSLLAGWILTNFFWQIPAVYLIADSAFMVMTLGLWFQSREKHLLTVALAYLPMLATNLSGPGFPFQMVVLNVLYGVQLLAVSRDAWTRWTSRS